MRYIGCKRRLLPFMHDVVKRHCLQGDTFCDLFAGTATVGNHFKQQGHQIISNDFLACSYIQQQVKIAINAMPRFEALAEHLHLKTSIYQTGFGEAVMGYLNQLEGVPGFMYQHYAPGGTASQAIQRCYFTDANAKKISTTTGKGFRSN